MGRGGYLLISFRGKTRKKEPRKTGGKCERKRKEEEWPRRNEGYGVKKGSKMKENKGKRCSRSNNCRITFDKRGHTCIFQRGKGFGFHVKIKTLPEVKLDKTKREKWEGKRKNLIEKLL
jgi:hypothetical protein